jgi:hypothetical protein
MGEPIPPSDAGAGFRAAAKRKLATARGGACKPSPKSETDRASAGPQAAGEILVRLDLHRMWGTSARNRSPMQQRRQMRWRPHPLL